MLSPKISSRTHGHSEIYTPSSLTLSRKKYTFFPPRNSQHFSSRASIMTDLRKTRKHSLHFSRGSYRTRTRNSRPSHTDHSTDKGTHSFKNRHLTVQTILSSSSKAAINFFSFRGLSFSLRL